LNPSTAKIKNKGKCPALRRLSQFKANLVYIVKPCLKKRKKKRGNYGINKK
jgi:hypothetical protein